MWTNSLLITVLGVGLLVVLAVVLAMVMEIVRQAVLDKQGKPMQRSIDDRIAIQLLYHALLPVYTARMCLIRRIHEHHHKKAGQGNE